LYHVQLNHDELLCSFAICIHTQNVQMEDQIFVSFCNCYKLFLRVSATDVIHSTFQCRFNHRCMLTLPCRNKFLLAQCFNFKNESICLSIYTTVGMILNERQAKCMLSQFLLNMGQYSRLLIIWIGWEIYFPG
jgi:hypothetical protein